MHRLASTVLLGLAVVAPSVVADNETTAKHPYLEQRNVLVLGTAWQEADATIRATVDPLPEQEIELGQLGLDTEYTSYYAEWRHRLNHKWGLIAAAQTFQSEGDLRLARDINFGGVEFPASIGVDSELGVGIYFIDLMYNFYTTDQAELSLGFGVHAFDTDVSVDGRVFWETTRCAVAAPVVSYWPHCPISEVPRSMPLMTSSQHLRLWVG